MQPPIAIYCSSRAAGGRELNVVRLAEWLRASGHPVFLITAPGTRIAADALALRPPFRAGSSLFSVKSCWQLGRLLRKLNPDSLFIHTSSDLRRAVVARILANRKTRLVFVQHMQLGVAKRDPLHTWFFRRVSAWIAPLPYLARQVRELTRFRPERIFEIPFGANLDELTRSKPCPTRARLQLALPAEAVLAGIVGRFDRQKNQALLITAAAPLIHAGMPLHLVLVGENTLDNNDDYEAQLRTLATAERISHRVHFRPFTQDIASIYAALDIFVLTSENETFGMVTIEAMAAGLPVIGTRSGGTAELVHDRQDGLLFEPGDANALRNALERLVRSPRQRAQMGRAAQDYALRAYSHREYIGRIQSLLNTT